MTSDRWRKIDELYRAALERDPGERVAFLAGACRCDDELKREVEFLLAQDSDGKILDRPAMELLAESAVARLAHYKNAQSLSAGDKLGPYEIITRIGAGGMGTVYKARDTRLGRTVALKLAKADFGERFEREARTVASLNHPNICTLHDVGPNYLVMELIEGESPKGPLPLETVLGYARQIAGAMDAAHEKGIVHRDLKPANIKIKPDGTVKVLDFGLAKVARVSTASAEDSPTFTMNSTEAGMILGTAAYMSPEQACGKAIDKRADIWAFGVVLCELLTGRRLFHGDTIAETMASVVKEQPDLSGVPSRMRPLLERCLEKDPGKRLRDIGDMALMLESAPRTEVYRKGLRQWIGWAIAVVLLAVLAATLGIGLWRGTRRTPPHPMMRLKVDLRTDTPLARANGGGMLALSPDGTRLAVTFRDTGGKVQLGTRALYQDQIVPLAGTEGAGSPFFSPDGQWIGFFAEGKLKKIPVSGGAPVVLCDAHSGRGASWGDDGNIVFTPDVRSGLFQLSSNGGTPIPITRLAPGENSHRWPQVLPGSQWVLFIAHSGPFLDVYDDSDIDVVRLKTGERKTVQHRGFSARYLAPPGEAGHLIYLHRGTLFAAPFDLSRLALAGSAVPVLEDAGNSLNGLGDFTFSQTGTFVYLPRRPAQTYAILWLDSSGKQEPLHAPPATYATPRFSPDGKRLAFAAISGQVSDIWVKDLERDTTSRLTSMPGNNNWPVWTPDGRKIVFKSLSPKSPEGLYWVPSDGSGRPQQLNGAIHGTPNSFSPDGRRLAFSRSHIFTAAVESDAAHLQLGTPTLFLDTPFNEHYPSFSPDGRFLAFASNESGTWEVYVRRFPGPGGRWQISTGGGLFPLWSRTGQELFFQTLDGRIMTLGYVANGDSFDARKPRVWSQTRVRVTAGQSTYDLAPNGKRFAVLAPDDAGGETKPLTQATFLLNFFDELERSVPSGK